MGMPVTAPAGLGRLRRFDRIAETTHLLFDRGNVDGILVANGHRTRGDGDGHRVDAAETADGGIDLRRAGRAVHAADAKACHALIRANVAVRLFMIMVVTGMVVAGMVVARVIMAGMVVSGVIVVMLVIGVVVIVAARRVVVAGMIMASVIVVTMLVTSMIVVMAAGRVVVTRVIVVLMVMTRVIVTLVVVAGMIVALVVVARVVMVLVIMAGVIMAGVVMACVIVFLVLVLGLGGGRRLGWRRNTGNRIAEATDLLFDFREIGREKMTNGHRPRGHGNRYILDAC